MTHLGDIQNLRFFNKENRIASIDLMRGIVMILMALDHVRAYFHQAAFSFNPTDLAQTHPILFFTRFITHYCAPVFVLLAGISAYLYGINKTRKELSRYLFTRGVWLVFTELFIVVLGHTFNPQYPFFNLQVLWAIGTSMMVLSALIYLNLRLVLLTGLMLVALHNLLDTIHLPGNFLWSLLHEPATYTIGHFSVFVQYPLLPWMGIISVGYCLGRIYTPGYHPAKRKKILLSSGFAAIVLFIVLRLTNLYGDPAPWSVQENTFFSLLSFLNVTKYPPSLLYTLVTLGPSLVFLALAEKPLTAFTRKIAVFGRVAFFYYLAHIYLIHLLAMAAARMIGYGWSDMILTDKINRVPGLKDYGFTLLIVYLVWIGIIMMLYPLCKWFDRYKRNHVSTRWWLSYI